MLAALAAFLTVSFEGQCVVGPRRLGTGLICSMQLFFVARAAVIEASLQSAAKPSPLGLSVPGA